MKLVLLNGFFILKHKVTKKKKRQVLLRCLEDSAFTLASQRINTENDITYDNLKAALVEAFSDEG